MVMLLGLIKTLTEHCALHSAKYALLEGKKLILVSRREVDISD